MLFHFFTGLVRYSAFILMFCFWTSFSAAQPSTQFPGEEDTILVEKEVSQNKIPYHRILKTISKRLFQIDVNSMFTIGKNRRDAFVRNFQDYASQVKYRFNVREDEVEVKLSLNF